MADAAIPHDGKRQSISSTGEDGKSQSTGEDGKSQSTGEDGKSQSTGEDGKRQSTGEDGKSQSTGDEQVAKKLKSCESDEERANEAIRKLQLVYRKDEEDADVFRRLFVQYKKEYFLDKFVWNKIVKYMVDNLPSVLAYQGGNDGRTDEQRLFRAYMIGAGNKIPRPQGSPSKCSPEESPPQWTDEDEDEDGDEDEDDEEVKVGHGNVAYVDEDEIEEIDGEYI